jgi:alpha-L-fucosidase 2
MQPAWDSKFTININTEMNYWLAETCSLPECHLPLFEHLKRMWKQGKYVADKMYGCHGFVAHHNTDLWGDCAPQDIYIPATYWVMGGAWLCTHIWNHFSYTNDKDFLREMYPILKDAVLFFDDYLIEVNRELVTCPSVSPENTYIMPRGVKGCICYGSSMDIQILRDLFEGYIKASKELDIYDEIVEKTKEIINKLPKIKIGKYGQIMEWQEDYDEAEPGHRHISQLYALHPSHQISIDETPELAVAAAKTLERRLSYSGGHTGWSRAWIVNLYARLHDGDNALKNLNELWDKSTFENLMDNHPFRGGYVFQIDGNFGATAAIAEMLVQSYEDKVVILPALPKQWENGKVAGLTIYGGAKIDIEWKNGELLTYSIYSDRDRVLSIIYRGQEKRIEVKREEI